MQLEVLWELLDGCNDYGLFLVVRRVGDNKLETVTSLPYDLLPLIIMMINDDAYLCLVYSRQQSRVGYRACLPTHGRGV